MMMIMTTMKVVRKTMTITNRESSFEYRDQQGVELYKQSVVSATRLFSATDNGAGKGSTNANSARCVRPRKIK